MVKETRAEGAEDSLSRALPVTCTSRVCLPASRSGSYLHSADEAATVLRRPRVLLLPQDSQATAVHVGVHRVSCKSWALSQDGMCRRI